jgi:hypothetical protein
MLYVERMFDSTASEEQEDNNTLNDPSNDDAGEGLTESMLILIGSLISGIWLLGLLLFICTCKKEYRHTFVSTATSMTFLKRTWDWQQEQEPRVSDEAIVKLFKKNHSKYKHFELEVSAFVSDNWEKWNYEKPKFFTKKFIASIPFSVLSKEIREEIDG